MKKIFFRIALAITLICPVQSMACGKSCTDGVCTESSCEQKCGCGCKSKFYQTWQFWTVVGAIGLGLILGSRNSKFENVKL